jgi:hypothetical protein
MMERLVPKMPPNGVRLTKLLRGIVRVVAAPLSTSLLERTARGAVYLNRCSPLPVSTPGVLSILSAPSFMALLKH